MRVQIRRVSYLIMMVLGFALILGSSADEKSVSRPIDLTQPAAAATIERIIDQAITNIGRRYNLNDAQLEETDRVMKKYVHEFLEKHEDEIWPAIRELLASNLQPPKDQEDLKRLGKSARKLAKLAHQAVKDGNAEWRKILTDEQKKTHDFDMAELDKTFSQMDQNFGAWTDGRKTDDPIFGPPSKRIARGQKGPPTPHKPPKGKLPTAEKKPFELTVFDTFVEGFIKDYELDAAQIVSARSILKEFKANAKDFRNKKKLEFSEIEKEHNAAIAKGDIEKRRQAATKRKKLIEPIYRLFGDMEGRLKGLLTTAQVERYKNKAGDQKTASRKTVKKRPTPKKNQAKKTSSGTPKPDTAGATVDKSNR